MFSQPINTDVCRMHYSLADACCFCSSVVLFSTSYWSAEWVGVNYMCPHPPDSFRIRVECHFLPLFPSFPPPLLSPLRLSQLSALSPIAQDVKSAHTSQLKRTPLSTSCTIWVCLICFLLRTRIRTVSNTESIKVHYPGAGSLDSSASCSICPDDLLNDSAKCLVKLHTAALGRSFFRNGKGPGIHSASYSALFDGWLVSGYFCLSTVTV